MHLDWLSLGLFHGWPAKAYCKSLPHYGVAAVLDIAVGAHLCLAGAAAKKGVGK